MTVLVRAPNGQTVEFPEGTNQATINSVMQEHFAAADVPPAPDKYQQAAIDEQAQLKSMGAPGNPGGILHQGAMGLSLLGGGGNDGAGFTRRVVHGATLGADSTILAGLQTPLEMIKRGTIDPREAYNYAKAREDQIMGDARENTGALGTAAEVLGGGVAGAGLAKGLPFGFAGLTPFFRRKQ